MLHILIILAISAEDPAVDSESPKDTVEESKIEEVKTEEVKTEDDVVTENKDILVNTSGLTSEETPTTEDITTDVETIILKPKPPMPLPTVYDNPPGSIWSERGAQSIVGQAQTPAIGDLVTVQIHESNSSNLTSSTSTSRSSGIDAGISTFFGLENKIKSDNSDLGGGIGIGVNNDSAYDGKGSTNQQTTFQGLITCTVMEILPNGHLIIEGHKDVTVNRDTLRLQLKGIVRPRDIMLNNLVSSHLLADSQIEVVNIGVIGDKSGPGFGQRLFDRIWPF